MATSATTTFNLTAQDFIDLSLIDIGATGPEASQNNPNLRSHALKLLNIIVKSIDRRGILTWRAPRRAVTMTAGLDTYTLAGDSYDVEQPARYVQAGSTFGSQVTAMAREEYMQLPDRTIQGTPFRYYAERALDAAGLVFVTVYIYPVPPNTGDTIEFANQVRAADLTDLAQTLDVNQKWLDAIHWRLTHDLCPAYNVPLDRMGYFGKLAEAKLDDTFDDDNERGDVQFVPFSNQTYRYGGVIR